MTALSLKTPDQSQVLFSGLTLELIETFIDYQSGRFRHGRQAGINLETVNEANEALINKGIKIMIKSFIMGIELDDMQH